jgi:stress response protein YsnF
MGRILLLEHFMHHHSIVGIFGSRSDAENVRSSLRSSGIPESDIALSSTPSDAEYGAAGRRPPRETSFWDWLFGSAISDDYLDSYHRELGRGRTAVCVRVRSDSEYDRVADLMDRHDPIEIEDGDGRMGGEHTRVGTASTGSTMPMTDRSRHDGREEKVIPVTKEELEVGKRQTERRYRVRTHVIERPVEEQVHLRDERVTIERRPASGTGTTGRDGLQERDMEIIERHEEPVVAKRATAKEEVVIRKEAKDRVETVRDKVRETKVDVDKGTGRDDSKLGRRHSPSSGMDRPAGRPGGPMRNP